MTWDQPTANAHVDAVDATIVAVVKNLVVNPNEPTMRTATMTQIPANADETAIAVAVTTVETMIVPFMERTLGETVGAINMDRTTSPTMCSRLLL